MMRFLVWLLTVVAVVATMAVVGQGEGQRRWDTTTDVVVYAKRLPGITLVVPADAIPAERRAALLVQETLATASGLARARFPIQPEGLLVPRRALLIGATGRNGAFLIPEKKPPYDTAVGVQVAETAIGIRSERRESIESAASWFLEKHLGAHWFMPGPLGEVIPRRGSLTVAQGEEIVRPGFLSRDLGVSGQPARAWYVRNRLESRFEYGHALHAIFTVEHLQRWPEMAPMRLGQRYIPTGATDNNWQPNFLSPAAVEHTAAAAHRAFVADPKQLSFSVSTNDGFRYDDSPATLAAVAPARFFRHRPDYSNLVFRFTNEIATRVAQQHPDRYLLAYAYYWCENAPDFPIARNVVPFLTADRSQWSHPEFAAEDRALIERWTRSGAEIVGVYDYFYGAPFLAPRPTLYAVKETIPFHARAGVKAFLAEMNPNWALDGPKPWLAAQLLWAPERNSEELLDLYFREFWAEAEQPMRAFFALCEQAWREHRAPALWLRYYQDEDQAWIYSHAQRAELRRHLDAAAGLAQSEVVRARVAFAQAGFRVTEAFGDFWDARVRVSRLARPGASAAELEAAWRDYRRRRAAFEAVYAETRREQPLAIAAQQLDLYLRNEPDSRVARLVAGRPEAADVLSSLGGVSAEQLGRLFAQGVEQLQDPLWRELHFRPIGGSAALDWTESADLWRGHGEPWEGRQVEMRESGGRKVLRIASARTEQIGQWVEAKPGALYAAQVKVRAKSSPGTATFLILNFLDEKQQHIGFGKIDRVPPGEAAENWDLSLITRAPANARYVGVGLRVLNQLSDDFAEFSEVSLKRWEE